MKATAWLALAAALASFPLRADAADVESVLARLSAASASVTSISGDFNQVKRLAMLREELRADGRLAYQKTGRLRWEIIEPAAGGFAIDGRRGIRWQGRDGQATAFDPERDPRMSAAAKQLLIWLQGDFDAVRREFTVVAEQEKPAVLRLTHKNEAARSVIRHLRLRFADDDSYVVEVEILEQDGDSTSLVFNRVTLNAGLDPELFRVP